jgi:phosphatidylserine decarboxylase
MKHSGKALGSGLKLIGMAFCVAAIVGGGVWWLGGSVPAMRWVAYGVGALWTLFTLFTLYFFRDPEAKVPAQPNVILCPGHGKVDLIDQVEENQFMKCRCHRISIFLSVIDIHVQNAPVGGKIAFLRHTPGQFLSAVRSDCSEHNENVMIGFESSESKGEKIGARLIAGLIARRIVPFVKKGDDLARGERMSLIQFGSRCDLYIPLNYKIQVKLGDRVVGGETIMAAKS